MRKLEWRQTMNKSLLTEPDAGATVTAACVKKELSPFNEAAYSLDWNPFSWPRSL